MTSRVLAIVLTVAATAAAAPVVAGTYVFTGTRANVNVIDPPGTGRCAPLNTVRIEPGRLSSSGTSNFGNFASTQSHCIPGPPSAAFPLRLITDGIFSYAFDAGDVLTGTYSGTATFADGVATGIENLIATGGTGRFAGASGTLRSEGPLSFMPNPSGPGVVGVFAGTIAGHLDLPAVPEPATWALMVSGFGVVGSALRRRRGTCVFA